MPFAQFTATGNGSTKQFTIPFPYVKKDHIVVALNNVTVTGFSFINDTTIEFDTISSATSTQETSGAPKNGVGIEITRDTPLTSALVDFVDGSTLTAGDLDTAVLQLLYGIQEAKDEAALGIQNTPQGQDAKNKPIINVSDPTNAQDAVTKAFLERVGSITSTQIADGTIVNADVNASAAIEGSKLQAASGSNAGSMSASDKSKLDGIEASAKDDQTASEIKTLYESNSDTNEFSDAEQTKLAGIETAATADQTAAEIRTLVESASDSNVFTDNDHTKLNGIETGATADQTDVEIKTAYENNSNTNAFTDALLAKLNAIEANATTDQTISEIKALIAGSPLDSSHLAANSVGVSEIADAELSTLAGMQSGTASKLADSTALTSDIADLNQLDGMAKETTITDDDAKFPTSGAVVDYVAAQLAPIGGLEVIADDQSFPNTQPSSGVVISIADAGGLVVNGSGTSTTARTANGTTVTINNFASNFNSSTVDAGVAIMVSSTGSGQIYNYHKATLKEADLLNLSNDINDFGNRYRVTDGEPSSNNDEGDLIYDKQADKMKVYDSTTNAFKEVTSVGDFKFLFLCPVGGNGSPTINGSIASYDLRESSNTGAAASVTNAAQLLVSINGVVQKPNSGTSAPSEGFAMVDSNTIIFGGNLPSGAEVFVIQIGSAIALQVPADNTVSSAKLQNGSVQTAKLADQAVTLDKLLHGDSNSNGKFLRANNGADPSFETIDLTNLSASNLTSGTIPDARFPATLPAIDGSNLTGITSTTINNNAANRVMTGEGGTTLNGEANFTYDGTYLNYTANVNHTYPSNTETNYMASMANSNGIKYVFRGDGLYLGNGLTGSNQGGGPSNTNIHLNTNGNIEAKYVAIQQSGATNLLLGSTNGGGVKITLDGDSNGDGSGGDFATIEHDTTGNLHIRTDNPASTCSMAFSTNGSIKAIFDGANGHFRPGTNNTYDLGTNSYRWRNVYTNDLNLSNEGSSNDVDGTWGSYTIQEGAESLFLINKRNGKKYKFNLTEVS